MKTANLRLRTSARVYGNVKARPAKGSGRGAAAFDGAGQGHLVGVLQIAAHGQTPGEPRHVHAQRRQTALEVARGRITFDVGIGRQDHLLNRDLSPILDPTEQLFDLEVFDRNAVERVERAVQHVIQALVDARALEGDDRERVLDDADGGAIALIRPTDGAWFDVG